MSGRRPPDHQGRHSEQSGKLLAVHPHRAYSNLDDKSPALALAAHTHQQNRWKTNQTGVWCRACGSWINYRSDTVESKLHPQDAEWDPEAGEVQPVHHHRLCYQLELLRKLVHRFVEWYPYDEYHYLLLLQLVQFVTGWLEWLHDAMRPLTRAYSYSYYTPP